jgi:hypothetical protein
LKQAGGFQTRQAFQVNRTCSSWLPNRRAAEILKQAGFDFVVRPAAVDETPLAGESPQAVRAGAPKRGCRSRRGGHRPGR